MGYILVGKEREYVVSVKSSDDSNSWIDAFQKIILQEHEAKGTGRCHKIVIINYFNKIKTIKKN